MWLILSAVLGVLLYAWIHRRQKHFSLFRELGVPGPEPNLLLGNAWEYYQKSHTRVFDEWHRRYGPVVGIFMGYKPMLLVSDVELLKSVFVRDFTDFMDRDQIHGARTHSSSLLSAEPTLWKNMRRIITPSFTSSKLRALAAPMNNVVKEFTANLSEKLDRETDVKPYLQALTLDVVARNAFGVNYRLQTHPESNEFFQLTRRFMSKEVSFAQFVALGLDTSQWLLDALRHLCFRRGEPGMQNSFQRILDECAAIVAARRKHGTKKADLLQLLMDASASASDGNTDCAELSANDDTAGDDDKATADAVDKTPPPPLTPSPSPTASVRLTDKEIVQNSFAVMVAGFETTASTLTYVVNVLIHRPDVQETLREEILASFASPSDLHDADRLHRLRYLDAVVKETLRMFPPVGPFAIRTASVDKVYGKWRIPRGLHVIASLNGVHRSPTYWEKPDEFDPSRFLRGEPSEPAAWLPFGLGPRNCVGMRFAQLEMKMIIAELLWHFRVEKSPNSPKFPPDIEALNVLSRLKGPLQCRIVRHER